MSGIDSKIKHLDLSTRRKVFSQFIGSYTSLFKGQGIEFEDLREYVPGDNVKDIDWNATARSGKLFVRKYIESRELTVLFAVDVSSSMNWGTIHNYTKSDIARNLIFLISLAAEANNDRVGAVFFSEMVQKEVTFKKGRTHLLKILNEYSNYFIDNHFIKTNLEPLFKHLLDVVKKRTICFIITDQLNSHDTRVEKLLKAVNRKHEVVFIHIRDSMKLLQDLHYYVEFQDIETGETVGLPMQNATVRTSFFNAIEENTMHIKKTLKRAGISHIAVNQESDLLYELITLFKRKRLQKQ